jgi:hypothetical protein
MEENSPLLAKKVLPPDQRNFWVTRSSTITKIRGNNGTGEERVLFSLISSIPAIR